MRGLHGLPGHLCVFGTLLLHSFASFLTFRSSSPSPRSSCSPAIARTINNPSTLAFSLLSSARPSFFFRISPTNSQSNKPSPSSPDLADLSPIAPRPTFFSPPPSFLFYAPTSLSVPSRFAVSTFFFGLCRVSRVSRRIDPTRQGNWG